MPKEKRVLLKISGESLGGQTSFGIKREALDFIAEEINSIENLFELAIVVGGGNLIRGQQLKKDVLLKDSIVADQAGMLATIINAIILQDVLEKDFGLQTRVMSALEVRTTAEPYIRRRAINHLLKGRIVILAGGTGSPDFSTDTAMILRAHEIGASMVLKGTKVEGVFDKDPKLNPDAKFMPEVSYMDFLNMGLKIVDKTAVTQAMDRGIEIRIFDVFTKGNLKKVLIDGNIGSVIH